jgi:hypothetical protein
MAITKNAFAINAVVASFAAGKLPLMYGDDVTQYVF